MLVEDIISESAGLLKLGFSGKTTKFEKKIFVVLLTRVLCSVRKTAYLSKSRGRFLKTNGQVLL